MYVIIGSHFVPIEGKFLLIELVIVRITLNVICVENISCALDTKFKRLFFLLFYGSKFDQNKILSHYTCYIG
jgi:hypothetical protein